MGRKIPGKKHRGVKDPYAQHAKRIAGLKTKINKTPVDPDEQPIPKTLLRLMAWKTPAGGEDKGRPDPRKPTKPAHMMKGVKKPTIGKHNNPVNKLKKLQGESKKSFNVRINDALKSLKDDKGFNDIDEIPEEKEPKKRNEDAPYIQRKGKKRRVVPGEPFLTKSQKRTLKEKEKKERIKQEKEMDQRYVVQKDDVKFGEVVHEPPSLKIKPRQVAKNQGVPRPARKDLLLNKLFDKGNTKSPGNQKGLKPNITVNQKKTSGVDLKGRRRDLPDNVRRRLEQSQKEAIEAYKLIKLQHAQKKNASQD